MSKQSKLENLLSEFEQNHPGSAHFPLQFDDKQEQLWNELVQLVETTGKDSTETKAKGDEFVARLIEHLFEVMDSKSG